MESEKQVEKYLRERIKALGGRAYKWVSPGNTGVPDRIVIIRGKVLFLELKGEKGTLTTNQKVQLRRLRQLSVQIGVIGSKHDVDTTTFLLGHPKQLKDFLEGQAEKYGV